MISEFFAFVYFLSLLKRASPFGRPIFRYCLFFSSAQEGVIAVSDLFLSENIQRILKPDQAFSG
jgi:hypothetical protein